MEIINIDLSKCRDGDIVASDIYGDNGRTLLISKETILNEYIIHRLLLRGINYVRIYRSAKTDVQKRTFSEYIIPLDKKISLMKDIFQNIVSGKENQTAQLEVISEQVYGNLREYHTVSQCLSEIKNSDDYTYVHSINVAFYVIMIGEGLRLSEGELKKLFMAGLLHDIGKTRIPEEVLNKQGELDRLEMEVIKNHTVLGSIIVEMIYGLDQDIKNAILLHHERMDGSGYPFGFTKKNISLLPRIIAVADVFDAMTTDRIYGNRRTPFDVISMFLSEGLEKFDIPVINAFTKKLANNLIGCKVLLNTDEIGEIVYVPYHQILHPIVKISEKYIDLSENKKYRIVKMI